MIIFYEGVMTKIMTRMDSKIVTSIDNGGDDELSREASMMII